MDCSQFINDDDILRQFPFPVKLNAIKYDADDKTTAQISQDGTFVESITIKNEDLVPLSLFCLSNVTSLRILFTPFENGMFCLLNVRNFILNIYLDIVPDALANLKTLKYLNIFSVPVKKMTKQLATLTNLEMIMFSNCSLTHLPDFSNLHKLRALSLPYNNFIQTDELQDLDLQTLDLSGNNLTEIPILKNKEHLLVLYLSNNPLKNAERILFYPNLYLLYMDHAMLTSIPPAIDKLSELEYLFIFGNQLTDLPPNILNLSKLQNLIASENLFSPDYIESIKEAFKKHRPTTTLTI